MNFLFLSQLRDSFSRPITTIALLLNQILAMFAIIVVHIASHTLEQQVQEGQLHTEYQYIVPLTDSLESSYFELRKLWRAGELPTVVGMMPVIEGKYKVNGRPIPIIGIDIVSDSTGSNDQQDSVLPLEFFTEDIVIVYGGDEAETTAAANIKIPEGQSAELSFLFADIATAQSLLNRPGQIDAVWLRSEEPPIWNWVDSISPGLTAGLKVRAPEISLPGFDIESMTDWNPMQSFGGAIAFNMGTLGMLAILVSGFIVYESTSNNIRRRQREFDRLHTLGVTNFEIRSVVASESIGITVVAAFLATGLAFAFLKLTPLIEAVIPATFWIATAKSACLGSAAVLIGIALAFASSTQFPSRLTLVTVLITTITVLSYSIWMSSNIFGTYLATLAAFALHIVVLAPGVVKTLAATVSRLTPRGLISRMNLRAVQKHFQRANVAVIAFSLAIGTAIGITLMVYSLRTDVLIMLESRFPTGLQIRNAALVDADEIRQRDGVEFVREHYLSEGNLPIGKTNAIATTMDEFEAIRYGDDYDPDNYGFYINEKIAFEAELQEGDLLTLFLPGDRSLSLPVTHIFKTHGEASRFVIVPIDQVSLTSFVRDRVLLEVRPEAVAELQDSLTETYPETNIMNSDEVVETAVKYLDQTFALANLIALIAVIVAVIGIFNSALAKQSAQQQEYRLLSTLGFARLELFQQSFIQSSIFGFLCCVLSLPLGFSIAWILCELVNPRAFQWTITLHASPVAIGIPLLLGLTAAILASLLAGLLAQRNTFRGAVPGS